MENVYDADDDIDIEDGDGDNGDEPEEEINKRWDKNSPVKSTNKYGP